MTTAFCPSCGYDLERDKVYEEGAFRFDPRGTITWDGRPVHFGTSERLLIWSAIKGRGRLVPWSTIMDRMDTVSRESAAVFLSRVRKIMIAATKQNPIATVWGAGIMWIGFGKDLT